MTTANTDEGSVFCDQKVVIYNHNTVSMLRTFFISFSVMFAVTNLSADIGELIAPGNEWTGRSNKAWDYFGSVLFAFLNTFWWERQEEKNTESKSKVE